MVFGIGRGGRDGAALAPAPSAAGAAPLSGPETPGANDKLRPALAPVRAPPLSLSDPGSGPPTPDKALAAARSLVVSSPNALAADSGRLASMATRLRAQLVEFADGLAKQDALLAAGQEECARLHGEQTDANARFGSSVLSMMAEQRHAHAVATSRIETQRSTLIAVNAERDELRAEKKGLSDRAVEAERVITEKDKDIEARSAANAVLEKELKSKDAQLSQTESELSALHEENARLMAELEEREAAVGEAEGRRSVVAERNDELTRRLEAAEAARLAAEEATAALAQANALLENEIENGEVAVAALQAEQESAFASLSLEREALLSKNRLLAVQMEESRRRLEATRAEAEAIIAEEQDRNEELERKHEATLAELQKVGGDAALRPMLIEAQQQLSRERERLTALRREKEALEEARVAAEAAERERAGKLELLNRSLADFEKHRERSAAELGPGFQGLDSGETESVDGSRTGDGYSDLASTTSEAHDPSDVDGKRAAARRAKAAQNKQKFEALKAQRDQYKRGLRSARDEVERMRAEMQTVEALKEQVQALQENMFV